jgi:hypothetical protein
MTADRDEGDPFGWALGWQFAIAETLHIAGEDVPPSWQFRPSPFMASDDTEELARRARNAEGDHSYEDETAAALLLAGDITAEELTYAGTVLARYVRLCELAGRSY